MELRTTVAGRDPIRLRVEDHRYLVTRPNGETVELGPSVSSFAGALWGEFNPVAAAKRCGPAARKRATGDPNASDKAVMEAWEANGKAAADRGTLIHATIEAMLLARNQEHVPPPANVPPPCPVVAGWINKRFSERDWDVHPELIVYGTVYDGSPVIPGTIDLAAVNKRTGLVTLVDWKTGSVDDTRGGKDPYFGLKGTKLAKYSFQLGTYKLILERWYGVSVDALEVVQITPGETPTVHPAKPEFDDSLCASIVAIAANPIPGHSLL